MAHQQVDQYIDPAAPLDNENHEEFAFRYALIGNATEAYQQVYGVERVTARTLGSTLLSKVNIRSRVDFIQQCQTDAAFSTITRNLTAQKYIVHDKDAILTQVDDCPTQIAAATAILKANGRISNGSPQISVEQNNYSVVNISQVAGIEQVADKIIEMNNKIMARKGKAHNIIDAKATQENLT